MLEVEDALEGKDDLERELLTRRVWPRHGGSGGNCLRLFVHNTIEPRSQFSQSSDRQPVKYPLVFSSPRLRTGQENGLVSVRMQPIHACISHLMVILPQMQRLVTIACTTAAAWLNPSTGCGDVLTKPKLDKHRDMCHSSFDCIDCSKRFESPADYKGHTSCISEAEKYQKTLYNGGVSKYVTSSFTSDFTGSQKQNGPERNSKNQRSRQQGGGRQWGNNQSQWQQRNVNRATGANDTPLGTPARMSPVNDTPTADENTQKDRPAEIPKKRKAEQETTESNVCLYCQSTHTPSRTC